MSVEKAKGHINISYVETLFEYQKYMDTKQISYYTKLYNNH